MYLSFVGDVAPYYNGLQVLCQMGYFSLENGADSYEIHVQAIQNGLSITKNDKQFYLSCSSKTLFFRGLGLIIEQLNTRSNFKIVTEHPKFLKCGLQLDASGNSVPTIATLKKLTAIMALMGLNMLQLHIPDMIELSNHPYLGYMRGRYSREELKELDSFGNDYGIEIVPAIEILSGMDTVTRWDAYMTKIWEYKNVLLCGFEETYGFLEDIIKEMSICFTSKTIHLGTDSSQMLGLWKHLHVFGFEQREKILKKHLARVEEICTKYGYTTVLWGDSFYRTNFSPLEESVKMIRSTLSDDIIPVFEEWVSTDLTYYDKSIGLYQQEGKTSAFSAVMKNFSGVTPHIQLSLDMAKAALPACIDRNVDIVFLSVKSVDGAECSHYSTLPVLQLFGEISNTGCVPSMQQLSSRLLTCAKADIDDFLLLDNPNNTTVAKSNFSNPSKYLLYQDIVSSLFDCHTTEEFPIIYCDYKNKLDKAALNNEEWAYLFNTARDLCSVLELKCRFAQDLRTAYKNNDRNMLFYFEKVIIKELELRVNTLLKSQRAQWDKENKIQGFETVNIRLGGVIERLKTISYRLSQYLNGQIQELQELDYEPLIYDNNNEIDRDINTYENFWYLICTTNYMAF